MRVLAGAASKEGASGRMARPLVAVHSGKTTMQRSGLAAIRASRVVRYDVFGGGAVSGARRVRTRSLKSEVRRRRRVVGYEVVKTGSKMAAR